MVGVPLHQPVPFSHQHHVAGLGIDCRYCHTGVETSHFAGVPPTETCMTCHSQLWREAPLLEPVRASLRNNQPLRWNRVNDLPDFVYFNHSVHVRHGVGCSSCHGRGGPDAADLPDAIALHEMVPGLPPAAGKGAAAASGRFTTRNGSAARPGGARARAAAPLRHQQGAIDGLLDLPPMSGHPAIGVRWRNWRMRPASRSGCTGSSRRWPRNGRTR